MVKTREMDDDDADEVYSISSSKAVYRRSSRPSEKSYYHETTVIRKTDEPHTRRIDTERRMSRIPESFKEQWRATKRYEVDYSNQNYVRSKCNKNRGYHRQIKGRPYKYNVQYNNEHFLKSKLNVPKGYHRVMDVRGKSVPDNDPLADSTGWEFDYGPEFYQVEEDIPYNPEGKIIARGSFRSYGVKRNKSDTIGPPLDEYETVLSENVKEKLKYGGEFFQSDIPYVDEQKTGKISRGAYRCYDVDRNTCDVYSDELKDVDYDLELERQKFKINQGIAQSHKGKPFKRTILNKVYTMGKPESIEDLVRMTKLTLIPGEGEQTFYRGVSGTKPIFKMRKSSEAESYFSRPSHKKSSSSTRSRRESYLYGYDKAGDLEHTSYGREMEFNAEYVSGQPHKKSSSSTRSQRESHHYERISDQERTGFGRDMDITTKYVSKDDNILKNMPHHIEDRVKTIRSKMSKHLEEAERSQFDSDRDEDSVFALSNRGESHIEGYEKYVKKNGSELWLRTEEKRLHR